MVEILALGYAALALVCFVFIGIIVKNAYKNACSWCSHPMRSHIPAVGIRYCAKCHETGEQCYVTLARHETT